MKAKFTKDEWLIITEPKSSGMCSTATGHFHIETADIHRFVTIDNESREESKANAHLIAAAPDMYELIERIGKADQVWSMEEIQELLATARGEK